MNVITERAGFLNIVTERVGFMRVLAAFSLVVSAASLVLGCLSLAWNSLEAYPVPLLLVLFVTLLSLFLYRRWLNRETDRLVFLTAVLALASAVVLMVLPEYLQGIEINAIVHRSLLSSVFLLAVAVPSTCSSVYYFLGPTPRNYDISRYPLIFLPVLLSLIVYAIIIIYIVADGVPGISWSLLTTPFKFQAWESMVWQDGWPVWVKNTVTQIGMRNHILGTFLLMALTAAISLPIGVGTGIFVHQYARKRLASVVNFCTTGLRAISGIILALVVFDLTRFASTVLDGTLLNYIVNGFGYYGNGALLTGRSSFILASIFISLLVIPVVARATQEGLSSLPQDIKEGSLALGASVEHTLAHVMLPWSIPNVITGLLIGCAEAAGSLTIIFLVAGTGELGVSPLSETTSLAYLIFDCRFGKTMGDSVETLMGSYQNTAAILLLIITLGLTIGAMVLKKRTTRRYRGA